MFRHLCAIVKIVWLEIPPAGLGRGAESCSSTSGTAAFA